MSVLSEIHLMFPFHLILTSGPILIANNHQSCFELEDAFRGVHFIRVFEKNMGNPYCELGLRFFSIRILSRVNDRVLTNTNYLWSYPFDMFYTDFKHFSSNNIHTVLKY